MLKMILLTAAISITFSAKTYAEEEASIGKAQWMENMEHTLPSLLCQSDRYFIQCFQTTQKECLDMTQRFVEACLNNTALSLPKTLTPADRKQWGQIVGRCSYDLYEKFMQSKKKDLPDCHENKKQENKSQ